MSASCSSPLDDSSPVHFEQGVCFEQVSITCTEQSFSPIGGAEVVFDQTGIHIPKSSDKAFTTIQWGAIKDWSADWWIPSDKDDICIGVLLTLRTELASYALGLPSQDKLKISSLVSHSIQATLDQDMTNLDIALEMPDVNTSTTPQDLLEKDGAKDALFSWDKLQFVLVLVLIALILTAVTLILAQSAGAIHLRFLSDTAFNQKFPVRS